MKTTFTSIALLLSVLIFGQTPMTIENLPDLNFGRSSHDQIAVSNNKFVVAGGHVNGFEMTKNVETYNAATKVWDISTTNDFRDMSYMAKMENGKYLIGGGCSSALGVGQLTTTEIYDPANGGFTPAANMNVARTITTAATLTDGRVLVVGNWYASAQYAEIYDPVANTFTLTGAGMIQRSAPIIIPTNDGGAIVCGTNSPHGQPLTDYVFEKYNPATNSWSELTRTLFDGETSWDVVTYQTSVMTEQYKLPDGKYAVLVYKTDLSEARIISIDPATSKIEEIRTQKPISLIDDVDPNIGYGTCRTLMIDKPHKLIHIIQQASIDNQITLRIITINLATGSVNSSKMGGFDYSVASSNLSMLDDGRILFTGGNKFDNFTLSAKAFIITPAIYLETALNNPLIKSVNVRWSNQDQSFSFNQEISNATLYKLTGKALLSVNNSNKLSVNSLAKGIYIIKVKALNSAESIGLKVIRP